MRVAVGVLIFLAVLSSVPALSCTPESIADFGSRLESRKIYRPLISTNVATLRTTKINKNFPAANMFVFSPPQWLAPDEEVGEHLELRQRLFKHRPNDIYAVLPTEAARMLAASQELLELVAKHVSSEFPEVYQLVGDKITIKELSKTFDLKDHSDLPPLVKVGLLIQDDLTVSLRGEDGQVRLSGGFVATPTVWNLNAFLGSTVHNIHAGVAGYQEALHGTVDGLVRCPMAGKKEITKIMGRNNWFVVSNPELALPDYRKSTYPKKIFTPGNVGQNVFLRSELESLFILPQSKAVVFTIRPRVWPMAMVTQEAPLVARDIAEAIAIPEAGYLQEPWLPFLSRFLNTKAP